MSHSSLTHLVLAAGTGLAALASLAVPGVRDRVRTLLRRADPDTG